MIYRGCHTMSEEKDIRFTEKKVDESWKEQISSSQDSPSSKGGESGPSPSSTTKKTATTATSKPFVNLITSLGYQVMMHLGEIPHPETEQREVNSEAAREIIDLLVAIREKTLASASPEEQKLLDSLVPELQMKFSNHV